MLADERHLLLQGRSVTTTPLLVPSFSSKGFPHVSRSLVYGEEVITGAILVSAYDLHYRVISRPLNFAELIILDSGGYEASIDKDFSELGYPSPDPRPWNEEFHLSVVDNWQAEVPTILVSYDHPDSKCSFADQATKARRLLMQRANSLSCLLIKPESRFQEFIAIDELLGQLHVVRGFDVIGVTDKELGGSTWERMLNISRLRNSLARIGLNTPIHIFGGLDPLLTPLYFLAGADIFDSLTWLRLAYKEGVSIYGPEHGALQYGIREDDKTNEGKMFFENIYFLDELRKQMRQFLKTKDFKSFLNHREFLENSYNSLIAEIGRQ